MPSNPASSENQLRLQNITHSYREDEVVLKALSLTVRAGDFIGVIGPNGAGKSTLLKIAAGLILPDTGTVDLNGMPVSALTRQRIARSIGYLPQSYTMEDHVTVDTAVAMGRYPHSSGLGLLTPEDREAIEECVAMTECSRIRDRRLNQLSGGERQRVMLTSVLAQQPSYLILDEPTAGLDLHHQVSLFRMFRRLSKNDIGIVVVTHEINLAVLYCRDLMLMDKGCCLSQGSPADVLSPNLIKHVFGDDVIIGTHPATGYPIILPVAD